MFPQMIYLFLILSFPIIGFSPEQVMTTIKSADENTMVVLANRLGFPDETMVPEDKCQDGMSAQNVISIWQDSIAWTKNGKEVHAQRKKVDVGNSEKGGRTDHILIFNDKYNCDNLAMVFSHKNNQWLYLGHVNTNTHYNDLICKTKTFKNSEDYVLSLSWRTTGTGITTEGITHNLVSSQGIKNIISYPRSGYEVAISSWPHAIMKSKGDTLIEKNNDKILFTDNIIVTYYLHNEDNDNKPPILKLQQKSKKSVVSSILDHLIEKKKIDKGSKKEILKTILKREEMGSTAIGGRIAFPHARLDSVRNIIVVLAISQEGIDFDSLDQEPVNIIALLLSNQKEAGLHLKMLAFLARILRDKYFVQQLRSAKSEESILALVGKQQQAVR